MPATLHRSPSSRARALAEEAVVSSAASTEGVPADPADARREQIEQAAYRRAEARGFAPGGELDDWLAAEREVDGRSLPALTH